MGWATNIGTRSINARPNSGKEKELWQKDFWAKKQVLSDKWY